MQDIVVIPTYNERENIKIIVEMIFSAVPDISILVVDDKSPDGTGRAVNDLRLKYPRLKLLTQGGKEGLGKAYVAGFKQVLADTDIRSVIMMDADLSHDPKHLPQMLDLLNDYDVIIGSRYVKGGGTSGWELWRRLLSYFGNLYVRLVTGLPINDCSAGYNVIRADLLRKLDLDHLGSSGYAFIPELKYRLWEKGARFFEVPIIFRNRTGGESKMSSHIIGEGIITPWRIRSCGKKRKN